MGGGGGAFWSEITERGFLENLDKNLLFEECVQECACASQIVSHILRMWRLIKLCRFRIVSTRSTNQLINLLKEYTLFTLNENDCESGIVHRWVLRKFIVVFILNISKDDK